MVGVDGDEVPVVLLNLMDLRGGGKVAMKSPYYNTAVEYCEPVLR